jgi:hypothetical protein
MVAEEGFGRSLLAAAGVAVGGPFDVGRETDVHQIEIEPDERIPINALHLSTQAVFIRPDGSGDATLEDGGAYRQCFGAPIHTRTHWRYDAEAAHNWVLGSGPGLWRWQSEAFIAIPPDGDVPPPEGKQYAIPQVIAKSSILETERRLPRSVGEIGLRGLVLLESADWQAFAANETTRDDRNRTDELDPKGARAWRDAPALMRLDVAVNPATIPTNEKIGRYKRMGAGTAWFMPAELGLEDSWRAAALGQNPEVDYATIGKRWLGLSRGVGLAFGAPSTGSPWEPGQGFTLEFVPAGTTMVLSSRTSAGASTTLITVLPSGATTFTGTVAAPTVEAATSVTTPQVTLNGEAKTAVIIQDPVPTWTAHRTHYAPNRTGVLALDMAVEIETASFTAHVNTIHAVKSTGGAYTCTLPGITDVTAPLIGGERIIVADLDGGAAANNITINTDTLDTMIGGTSIAIEADYGQIEFVAVLDGVTGYWLVCEC